MNLKKILPVILLVALFIWGVYDINHKGNKDNNLGSSNINTNVKSDTGAEVKTGIQKGNKAPDFKLKTLDNKEVKLSDYKGKKVILNFWATWCPPCKAEIPDLIKFYEDFKDKDVVILGVDLTQSEKSQNAVADFLKSYGITYPVALDTDGTASKMYQVTGIPTSYIIDTQGIIRDIIVGPMDFEGMKRMLSGIN